MIAPSADLLAGIRPCRHCPTCRWRQPQRCLCGHEDAGVCGRYLVGAETPAVDAWLDAWRAPVLDPATGHEHEPVAPGAPDCPGWAP